MFICYSHSPEDIEKTVEASCAAISVIKEAEESGEPAKFLEGEPVGVVFRQKT